MYKLTIIKSVANENYEQDLKEYKSNQGYGFRDNDSIFPQRFNQEKSLEVELTDEEFKKLKAETIKIFN